MLSKTPKAETLPLQALFSYDVLDAETRDITERLAERIRQRGISMAQAYIDNGKDLLAAKERIPHGLWQVWLRDELGLESSTARKMMNVARSFGHIQLAESQVSAHALTLLTQYDISNSIRQEAEERIKAGTLTTAASAIDLVQQHDPVIAERMKSNIHHVYIGRTREIARDLALQVAEMSFAVRNMQVALADAYGVPLRGNVADALERLQTTADTLIQLVPQPTPHGSKAQGIKKSPGGISSSRFVGVTWIADRQRWAARLRFGEKRTHIGYFNTEEEAARAYDAKAREMYGDQARLNFPDEQQGRVLPSTDKETAHGPT